MSHHSVTEQHLRQQVDALTKELRKMADIGMKISKYGFNGEKAEGLAYFTLDACRLLGIDYEAYMRGPK